jgi:hypothetical protein
MGGRKSRRPVAVGVTVAVGVAVGVVVAVAVGLAVAVAVAVGGGRMKVVAIAVGVTVRAPASFRIRGTMGTRVAGVAVVGGSLEAAGINVSAVGASASGWLSTSAARRALRKKTSPPTAPATQTSANKLMAMIAHPLPPLFLLNPGPGRVLVGGSGRQGG